MIKTKENVKDVKVIDKAKAATHRVVEDMVRTKRVISSDSGNESTAEYGSDSITETTSDVSREVGEFASRRIRRKIGARTGNDPKKEKAKHESVAFEQRKRKARLIKTAENSNRAEIKTPSVTVKKEQLLAYDSTRAAQKAKKAEKLVHDAMKKTAQSIKAAARSLLKVVKGIISATKSLVAALAAGGSTTAVALVAMCAVALLLGSSFGVFFANETDGVKMREVVAELSTEYYGDIKKIEASVGHDRIEYQSNDGVNSLRWQDIISVYACKLTANNSGGMEAVTINDEKKAFLRDLMWEMSEVDYSTRTEIVQIEVTTINEDGDEVTELQDTTITVLVIEITHKTPEEMASEFSFTKEQNEQLSLMREGQYASYWAALLGGYLSGNGEIIMTDADWIETGNFSWPLPFNGNFNSGFGYRIDPFTHEVKFHGGIDLGAATGTSILAADGGTVIVANATDPYYGYGYYVMIDHGNGFTTLYGHCSSIGVVTGQNVSKGEVIAAVGSTGNSTGPHLHFEVYQGGTRVDPMMFFK